MAKRSRNKDASVSSGDVAETEIPQFADVIAMFPAKINAVGEVTKTKYTWSKGGDTVSVDVRDIPALLKRKAGNNLMFQLLP